MSNRWQGVAGDLFRQVSELEVIKIKSEARIAELEAELDKERTMHAHEQDQLRRSVKNAEAIADWKDKGWRECEAGTTARLVRDPAPMIELLELHAKEDAARIAELEAQCAPDATHRHYMRGYNAANARRRRYYVAELESDRDTLSRIIDTLGADNRRMKAEIARLTERVEYFEREYQDEIGRTELIENITTLKAERDRAQADAIAMTSWANALAAERDRLKAAPPIDFRCACQIAGEIASECLEQRRCQMRGQPR